MRIVDRRAVRWVGGSGAGGDRRCRKRCPGGAKVLWRETTKIIYNAAFITLVYGVVDRYRRIPQVDSRRETYL